MTTEPLPILLFPTLVQKLVIQEMDPFNQMDLSKCSIRCKNTVKSSCKNQWSAVIKIRNHINIKLYKKNDSSKYWNIIITDKNPSELPEVSPEFQEMTRIIQSDDEMSKMEETVSSHHDILKLHSIAMAFLEFGKHQNEIERVLKFLNTDLPKIEMVYLGIKDPVRNLTASEYKCLLENSSSIENIHIETEIENPDKLPVTLNVNMFSNYSRWVRLEDIHSLNCNALMLKCTLFKNDNVVEFVRFWLNGGNPGIREFIFQMENIDYEYIGRSLGAEARDPELVRTFTDYFGMEAKVFGGFDIRRESDQMLATIYLDVNCSCGSCLAFVVWKDLVYHFSPLCTALSIKELIKKYGSTGRLAELNPPANQI
ncbi:hypothetical protein CRE_28337 [Caenorhabditis remanei]|uniref:Sdz-33 F-box domain-containing protein n=1 Tax=Caenorhabditis remanei TaxID=31234 RepID=E3LNB9_CAERE|nr:hypothetical protein CRE_28337 [Caenorhabditis remanei]